MLDKLFSPRSVAVIGAAREKGKVGREIFDNLVEAGFPGSLYAVNPKASEVAGHKAWPDVASLPETPDLAVIVVPAGSAPATMADCAAAGTPFAVVISAGFRESGSEGARLEAALMEEARAGGVRVVGPNCLGVMCPAAHLNASFARHQPLPGDIAVISQSGAVCSAMLDWAAERGSGFSTMVSLGNRADLGEAELLDYLAADRATKAVSMYMEGTQDGRAFIDAASRLTKKKPLIVLKAGRTEAGARAASSHTGSLAGSEAAYTAAFLKAGAVEVSGLEELFEVPQALATEKLPPHSALAILTNAGGPGILASDACERAGLTLASFSAETVDELRSFLPPAAAVYNPVDILGDAGPERYGQAIAALLADESVGGLLVLLTPQSTTDVRESCAAVVRASRKRKKPLLACLIGGQDVAEGRAALAAAGLSTFHYPEEAVAVFKRIEAKPTAPVQAASAASPIDEGKAAAVLSGIRGRGLVQAADPSVLCLLQAAGIRVPQTVLARTPRAAVEAAAGIGYPVVLKVVSPDILHKTEVGGVRLDIKDEAELRAAWRSMMVTAHRYVPDAEFDGIAVQESLAAGREVILGVDTDQQFGHMLMFGLGGIFVEALRDVAFRLLPASRREFEEMVGSIRGSAVLRGMRNRPRADMEALYSALEAVSSLVGEHPDIIELDINPLILYDEGGGAVAADARIVLGAL